MKFINKIVGIHLLLLSTAVTFSLGNEAPKLAPITMGDGLVVFVPVPIVSLNGSSTVNLIVGKPYYEAGVSTLDGIEIATLTITGSVNIYRAGTYTIRYAILTTDGQRVDLTRTVVVSSLDALLPHDTNTYYAPYDERDYLYFADPQPSENGLNRAIRVNFNTMSFDENNDSIELTEDTHLIPEETHSNPHSIDRAGNTNKFYVRTQNAYSFDVVAVENGKLVYKKTVPLSLNIGNIEVKYSPRAFGAYNAKYNIQLLSGRNTSKAYSMVGIVDVATDEVLKHIYKPITGDGSLTTGHAKWLDEDHFAVVDRGNHSIDIYKVFINTTGSLDVVSTDSIFTGQTSFSAPLHALERVKNTQNYEDLYTFYGMGESITIDDNKQPPFVQKYIFNPKTGQLSQVGISVFCCTDYLGLAQQNVSATTHHTNITPDGKYMFVPVYDGKIYKIDRITMQIIGIIDTGLTLGLGAAHIEFSESLGIAVITNHWSPYVTIIETSSFTIKGYVKIYRDGHHDVHNPSEIHLMQPHFAQISSDGKYFYTFASQDDGRFVRVNLEEVLNLSLDADKVFQFDNNSDDTAVMKAIYTGGAPEQAHS